MHEIGIEWMTQTEVNGHFLELRGIPDEKLEWERIPEAIAGGRKDRLFCGRQIFDGL